jgi:hypothetical protein
LSFASLEVAAELGTGETTAEPAGLETSVETVEHVCQEVRNLLAKVHSTLDRVRDVSAPELMSTTMAGVLEVLALREDGEDPLIAAVHRQVTIGSESVFSMMMMHGVECDFDKVTGTYPKGKDGHDIYPKEYLERAQALSWRRGTLRRWLPGSRGALRRVLRPVELPVVRPSLLRELKLFAVVMDNVVLTSVCRELSNLFIA